MSNDYRNAYESYRPGDTLPSYSDLCKAVGHYGADQIQRGWQAAEDDQKKIKKEDGGT